MNKSIEKKVNTYKLMNKVSRKGAVVCFGSTYFSTLDVGELAMDSRLSVPVYNRSFDSLSVADAAQVLDTAVYELQPSKVFVNIGDEDIDTAGFNAEAFVNSYEWLLLHIHQNCRNCRIFITSVVSSRSAAAEVNSMLKKLAASTGCTFIDIDYPAEHDSPLQVFNMLKPYIRNFPLSFADAMQAG